MNEIMPVISEAAVTVMVALISLFAAYAVRGVNAFTAKLRIESVKMEDDQFRKFAEEALSRVEDLAAKTVTQLEQTTAAALREAVNDMDLEAIGTQNKIVRGYIIRLLVNGHKYSLPVKEFSNVLMQRDLIISPDISKYLDYLHKAGYIEFTPEKITAYTAYSKDAVS